MSLDFNHLYKLFKERNRNEIAIALLPSLSVIARDVIREARARSHTKGRPSPDWKDCLTQEGACVLLKEIERRFQTDHIEDGKHLYSSLRLPVRKAMRQHYFNFRGVLPYRQKRSSGRGGVPVLPLRNRKPFIPKKRVSLAGQFGQRSCDSRARVDDRFHASDPYKNADYYCHAHGMAELVPRLASEGTSAVLHDIESGDANSVHAAARARGLSTSKIYRELPKLASSIRSHVETNGRTVPDHFLHNSRIFPEKRSS